MNFIFGAGGGGNTELFERSLTKGEHRTFLRIIEVVTMRMINWYSKSMHVSFDITLATKVLIEYFLFDVKRYFCVINTCCRQMQHYYYCHS